MKGNYYDEKRYLCLLEQIRYYERLDLLVKVALSAVLLLVLLYLRSFWLAFSFFVILLAAKGSAWLFAKALRYALKKWCSGFFYKLNLDSSAEDKLGRYSLAEIRSWIDELCRELSVTRPVELLVYESKHANAFASEERWLGLLMRNRMGLLANVFHLLDAGELKAVIAHELGHHKHFPKVGVIVQLLIPALSDRPSYRQCLEHLSDWCAAKLIGVVPAANALIKVYHRGHLIHEISRGLAYVQKDFKIGLAGAAEFQEIANTVIPHRLKATESLDKHMAEIIDRYFEKRSGSFKGIGKSYVEKYRKDKGVKLERYLVKSRYRFIDWRIFDNRIKDNTLDELELENLYLHLKNARDAELFPSYAIKDKKWEKWQSHPPLRERLLFIIEASAPAPEAESAKVCPAHQ